MSSNDEIFLEMQAAGFNITTCGECSAIRLHRIVEGLEELNCESCGFESDPCDFPDLFVPEMVTSSGTMDTLKKFKRVLSDNGDMFFGTGDDDKDVAYIKGILERMGCYSGVKDRYYFDKDFNLIRIESRW